MAEFNNLTIESISIIDSDDDNESLINQQHNLFKNKLVLKLDLNFRDKLIQLLNEYTKSLISNRNISINRKELKKCKSDLIKLLTKTPSKLNKELNSCKFIINLDNDIRYKIIDLLIRNENIIIDSKDKIDLNCGNQLIEENNQLINKLNNQTIEFINNNNLLDNNEESNDEESNDDDSNTEESNDKESNTEETNNEDLNNEELNDKDLNLDVINLKKQSDDQNLEINKLQKQLEDQSLVINRLEKQLEDLSYFNSNSITINYVKKNITEFNKEFSKSISFKNVNWYIEIFPYKPYFSILLRGDYINSHRSNPIKLEYDIDIKFILKANKFYGKESFRDKVKQFTNLKFYIPQRMNICTTLYHDELLNCRNFINDDDDSMKLEVQLTINSISKLNY